jgi:hypothetical protein
MNDEFRATVESWTAVSGNVMILDNATGRDEPVLVPGANLFTLYDTMQYLRQKGVMGYQHIGYDRQSSEMDALRNYLLSRLLWDEDMTREEYVAIMDEFLQYYYGAGWAYVRQYIDKMYSTSDTDHTTYKKYLGMLARTTTKDSDFVRECIEIWNQAVEAADTDRHVRNVERSSVQMYKMINSLGKRDRDIESMMNALIKKYGLISEKD